MTFSRTRIFRRNSSRCKIDIASLVSTKLLLGAVHLEYRSTFLVQFHLTLPVGPEGQLEPLRKSNLPECFYR